VSREEVKEQIRAAFAGVERPGSWALRGSNEGEEPYLVDRDFADKAGWRTLDAAFLDWAPDGYGSARRTLLGIRGGVRPKGSGAPAKPALLPP